jgi:hypothetical protein
MFRGIVSFDGCDKKKVIHLSNSPPDPSAGVCPDLPKSSLWNKSGVSIYNNGDGYLCFFCCWRQLLKPETACSAKTRTFFFTTSAPNNLDNQHLPNTRLHLERKHTCAFYLKKKKTTGDKKNLLM